MAGVFGKWQPIYAEAGLVTFPVDADAKKPAVGNYLKAGRKASAQWAQKFAGSNALGLTCGRLNRLTVLDVDSPDENLLADALSHFGPSPVVIRTASGKFHAWFRHSGEARSIRSAMPGKPVDILGSGGMAIAPPSLSAKGEYQFIAGSLADCGDLPKMRISSLALAANDLGSTPSPGAFVEGKRNNQVLSAVMKAAHDCETVDHLTMFANAINTACQPPLAGPELARIVASAWGYTQKGENFAGIGRSMVFGHDQFDKFDAGGKVEQDAWFLLGRLRRVHHSSNAFYCANAIAESLGWSLPRIQNARDCLVNLNEIVELRRYSQRLGPTVYMWPAARLDAARDEMVRLDSGRQARGV